MPSKGHTVVLGTAGSGKTSMAILRGVYLQKECTNLGEKTLILTYNKMLVSYMKAFEEANVNGLVIENYHRVARGFLSCRGKIGYNSILNSDRRKLIISRAVENCRLQDNNSFFNRDDCFFIEEIKWIETFGLKTFDEYKDVTRVGRKSTKVNKNQRKYVWEVYNEYKSLRSTNGYLYDWDDIGLTVEDELAQNNADWYYRHIIVDEGQDFSPTMIRSLSAAIPNDGSLTFFGDVAQQIYGTRLSWKDAGLNPPKVWQFKENYRNTKEIAELAIEITRSPFYSDEPDLVLPNIIKAAAAKPSLLAFPNNDQYKWLINQVKTLAKTQQVAVLVRKRDLVGQIISDLLKYSNIAITELHPDRGNYIPEQGVMIGTYHSAKGLEFDTVFLPFLSKEYWPNPDRIIEIGAEDTFVEDIRLLYVGITRAKTRLILSYEGDPNVLLPTNMSLYNFREMINV